MNEHRIHQVFVVSVLLKGAHALIECVGGIALMLVDASTIAWLVNALTQDELVEDPHDVIATHLRLWAQDFSAGSQNFYAYYLLSHGAVKMFLVAGLLRNKLWAYPVSLVVMTLFIVYQLYRYSFTRSLGLIALSVLDVIVIGLIWHEYRFMRRHRGAAPP
jgi:uncharacterized membrane protein